MPLFNNCFCQMDNIKIKQTTVENDAKAYNSKDNIRKTEEVNQVKLPKLSQFSTMTYPSIASPFYSGNVYGTPHTQRSANGALNPYTSNLISGISPIAFSPRMDTFGDFEVFCNKRIAPFSFLVPEQAYTSPRIFGDPNAKKI